MHAGEVSNQAFINNSATKAHRYTPGLDEYGCHLLFFGNCEGGANVDTGCQRQRNKFNPESVGGLPHFFAEFFCHRIWWFP